MIAEKDLLDAMPIGTIYVNNQFYLVLTEISEFCNYLVMYRNGEVKMNYRAYIPQEFRKSYKLEKGERRI